MRAWWYLKKKFFLLFSRKFTKIMGFKFLYVIFFKMILYLIIIWNQKKRTINLMLKEMNSSMNIPIYKIILCLIAIPWLVGQILIEIIEQNKNIINKLLCNVICLSYFSELNIDKLSIALTSIDWKNRNKVFMEGVNSY